MSTPIRDRESCGGTVRTRKPEGWVCTRCVREGRHVLPGHKTPAQLHARQR